MPDEKSPEADLDFGSLSRFVFLRWKILSVFGLVGLMLGLAAAFLFQPVYRATTLLAPVTEPDMRPGLSSALSNIGGLASLAGVDIGADEAVDDYIAILRSRDFGIEFIEQQGLLRLLFSDDWDAEAATWFEGREPTWWDAWERFDRDVRKVEIDRATGHVRLSIEWDDPVIAADWANTIPAMVNDRIRSDVVAEAERSLHYLNEELRKAGVMELETAIFRLVETQVNRVMLANVRPEFAFRVLDPALAPDPDDFTRPNRPLLVVAGVVVGVLFGFLFVGLATFISLVRSGARDPAKNS